MACTTRKQRASRGGDHFFLVSFYQRRLPHWHPENASIFLTWRLYGSLPGGWEPRAPGLQTTPGRRFVETDRLLDRAVHGPTWLKNPSVAQCVIDTLRLTGQHWELFELYAWVVMSNPCMFCCYLINRCAK